MQDAKIRHLGTIAQLCRAISSQLRHVSTIGIKLVKQQCLPHMSSQYCELWPTSGWNMLASLWHPSTFQQVWCLGSVTARHWHSSSGRQLNFAALNRGHHLYSAGRPSRWALAHILVVSNMFCVCACVCLHVMQAFTTDFRIHWAQHPLRPEFVESTYFIYKVSVQSLSQKTSELPHFDGTECLLCAVTHSLCMAASSRLSCCCVVSSLLSLTHLTHID